MILTRMLKKYTKYLFFAMAVATMALSSCNVKSANGKVTGSNHEFQPGELWFDTDSVHINAHGGGVLVYDNRYYWFGEHKTQGRRGNTSLQGIRCYSSDDLYNWRNEGIALATVDEPGHDIEPGSVMERPKVIYNASTKKFVMWFHLELKGKGYSAARTAVATCDKVTGPYTYIRSYRVNPGIWPIEFTDEQKNATYRSDLEWWTPDWTEAAKNGLMVSRDFEPGQMARDMTLFVDDDGKAYHIHASEENLTLHIAELTPDYTGFTGKWTRVFPMGHNEAPAIFKHQGKYYMITSGCTGWDPNAARSAVAESIWGPWQSLGNPCVGEDSDLTFHSQSTFVLPVPGKEDAYIFMADRWRPRNPVDGRYIWLPLEFDNGKPVLKWYDKWDLTFFDQKK
ncbi:glycoside hydrolase family 43 protein [Saccharicrinis sp. FJH62]|uniref:glycoside hydrolase family 43 protein n=1 Tax=Saccharicrinis sp. FJH62 TaxID=3344657 RepID=UPI0035D42946